MADRPDRQERQDRPDDPEKIEPVPSPEEEEEIEEVVAKAPPSSDLDRTAIHDAETVEERTPSRKTPVPYVVICQGPRSGTRFPLSEGTNVVGRSPGCAVRLEDQSVSRQHAEINKVPGGWSVKDLGSKNGTVVNQSPVTEPVVIGHKDFIKVGIYLLRLVTQEISLAEEMTLPPEMVSLDRTVLTEMAPPEGLTEEMKGEKGAEEGAEQPPEVPPTEEERPSLFTRARKYLAPIGAGIIVIALAGYLAHRFLMPPPEPPKKEVKVPPTKPAIPTPKPSTPAVAVTTKPPVPAVQKIPVFLDFASSPLPAQVNFQGKELGRTPLRINVELEPNKTFEAEGVFNLPEVNERYVQRVRFTVDPNKPVIPLLIRGPIGMIKVNDLPRDVTFYLEGQFEYDQFKERPAKLNEIVLRKPIYLPFGKYTLELRKARQLGASQTYVQDIVFRRQFVISSENPTFVLSVTDDDIKKFPVTVRSDPPNAYVYIDGKKVGTTPYEGTFPLGEHTMTLRKEGYFEYSEELKVDINTPYTTTITLQTSVAGAHINNAQAAMNRQMWQQAINELAEALSSNPAPSEVAKANYMLGVSYFQLNDVQRAMEYFNLARQHEDQKYLAMLGLVRCYAAMNQTDKALPLLVEVMLNSRDDKVKREADGVFREISPLRSVVYIHTVPEGAEVTVNQRKVSQKTPLILHDMSLGTYKLHIEKAGYLPVDMRLDLSMTEFNPVIVTLKPIPK